MVGAIVDTMVDSMAGAMVDVFAHAMVDTMVSLIMRQGRGSEGTEAVLCL